MIPIMMTAGERLPPRKGGAARASAETLGTHPQLKLLTEAQVSLSETLRGSFTTAATEMFPIIKLQAPLTQSPFKQEAPLPMVSNFWKEAK